MDAAARTRAACLFFCSPLTTTPFPCAVLSSAFGLSSAFRLSSAFCLWFLVCSCAVTARCSGPGSVARAVLCSRAGFCAVGAVPVCCAFLCWCCLPVMLGDASFGVRDVGAFSEVRREEDWRRGERRGPRACASPSGWRAAEGLFCVENVGLFELKT